MALPLHTLLARVLLLLHMVRGAFGVSELGALLCKAKYLRLLAGEINRKTCRFIWKTFRKKVAEVTKLAHAEGLNAGLTGSHPLLALLNSQEARAQFVSTASAWSVLIEKFLIKGCVATSQDAKDLWLAVSNKVVLAIHRGKSRRAGRYTAMHLAGSMAMTASLIFHRQVAKYSKELHVVMSKSQSSGCKEGVGDVLGKNVFHLFYIAGYKEFVSLWRRLAVLARGARCSSFRVPTTSFITRQIVLVHLCEVRQCLQASGRRQLQKLMTALGDATEDQLVNMRQRHEKLMSQGYAGGSKCHAMFMVESAAMVLNVCLERCKTVATRGSRSEMVKLLEDMAHDQMSPNLSYLAIPEWKALQHQTGKILIVAHKISPDSQSFDELRNQVRKLGHVLSSKHNRTDLVAMIRSGPCLQKKGATLEELRRMVRAEGGNPQPEKTNNWRTSECRLFLLKRKKKSELQQLASPAMKRMRLDKSSLLTELSKDRSCV